MITKHTHTTIPIEYEDNLDAETRSLDPLRPGDQTTPLAWWHYIKYLVAGIFFGVLLVKSEAVSWFRIQEMFRLESFHMYGLLGSAVLVGALSVLMIRRFKLHTVSGEPVKIPSRKFSKGTIYGGLLFGFGWALTGACPGPMFALIGNGYTVMLVSLMSAIAGTWTYGLLRQHLPH